MAYFFDDPVGRERTRRQQALAGAVNAFGDMQKAQQQEELTKRQQALQGFNAIKDLTKQGVELSKEDQIDLEDAYRTGDFSGLGELMNRQAQNIKGQRQAQLDAKKAEREQANQFKQQQLDLQRQGLQSKQAQEALKKQESEKALEVRGFGKARTAKEAQELRQAQSDANEAVKLIDEIKELGTDVNVLNPFDRERINLIEQKKKILAGKLRLPLTGPGAMTQEEYERLIETIGDPTKLMSTEGIQKAKLDSLKDTIASSVEGKFRAMGSDEAIAQLDKKAIDTAIAKMSDPQTGQAAFTPENMQKLSDDELLNMRNLLRQQKQGTAYNAR